MNTAEKRAALEAEGVPWPDCECHGQPMSWNRDPKLTGGGRFRCRPTRQAWHNRRREERRQAGVCVHCGGPLATATMCQPCADRHADLMASPEQYLKHLSRLARLRREERAGEGFQPTGVGIAAMAAWIESNRGGTS